jgi:acyl-ACP thioesterase
VQEFVPLTDQGRRFREDFIIRLGDVDVAGRLRLDGLARLLQDVATDDSEDTGVSSGDTWVVRRTSVRRVEGARWPRYLDRVSLVTWCGGVGPAWAERRTNLEYEGVRLLEAAALWVPVDPTGRPVRLRESFFAVYGEAVHARRVSGRIAKSVVPDGAERHAWPLRAADVDVVGHVNNAALWQALSEAVPAPLDSASLTHHASIEREDQVTLVSEPGSLWLIVDGTVRVSAQYSSS